LVWGAAMFAVAKRDDARDIYGKVCTYFFCVATFFALGVSVLIKDALKIIATPQFLAAHRVVPIVMVGLLFLAAANFFETGIHLARRTVFRALAVGSAAGLTLLLNWLLVPRFGMMGAAWATLLSFAALAAVSYILGQRLYRITYEVSRLAKLTGVAAFLYWASTWVHVASTAGSIGVRCALVLLYPALLYVLGFYRHEELAKVARLGHVVATSAYGWLRYAPMRSSE
ncbi:MAG: polysaccharide biosynthesis C-terminal domain-containing protein, partial [Armatimonadota bacterium]